jgi:GTP-binding protein
MRFQRVEFVTSAADLAGCPPPIRPEIAFAGKSNVGKSTLINALVGRRNLAKVSQTPGKTRLLNFFDIDGRCYFVDLPGYGYAKVAKREIQGWVPLIETYLRRRNSLRCVVLLVDLRRGLGEQDRQLLAWLDEARRESLVVFTKVDKLKGNALRNQVRQVCRDAELDPQAVVLTSGVTKDGVADLWKRLAPLVG